MTQNDAATTAPVNETPTDTPKKTRKPRAAPRKFRLFDDQQGDYRIFEIVQQGHKTLPPGSLVQIPEMGGFESAILAKKAIRESGNSLTGKVCMILKGVEIVRIEVDTKPRVVMESKPRTQVAGPAADAAAPAAATA